MPPKYGLQLPPAGRGRGAAPRPAPALAAFGDDSDDDDGGGAAAVGRDVARQAARIAADEKVAAMHAAALAEDATAFEYDAVYDDLAAARGARAGGSGRVAGGAPAAPAVDRAPRYVADLLDRAKERTAADELAKERRLARQREEEDHLYGDKEVFVTAAYKEKLAARDAARAADAAAAAAEAAAAPAAVGNMAGFYKNLLTDNVALGTGQRKAEADKVDVAAAPPAAAPSASPSATAPPPPPPPLAAAAPPPKSPSPPPPQQPAGAQADDIEARAAAARERYLARKRARAGAA